MKNCRHIAAAVLLSLPMLAQAAPSETTGISAGIRSELADARKEMRTDLAKARKDLLTESLGLENSLRFGKDSDRRPHLPKAEITPQGDFLIEGKAQAIDPRQRRELLTYRGQVIDIAIRGIDIGERAGQAALDAVGTSWMGMLFGAMTGSLERRVERVVRQQVGPGVRDICRQLPEVHATQQRLASALPAFRPYATLDRDDIDECETEVRREFATR